MNRTLKRFFSAVALGLTLCLFSASFCSAAAASTSEAVQEHTLSNAQYDGPNGRFKVYLSPSAQPWNPYCDGSGSEEYYMRQVATAMIPYLQSYGIDYVLPGAQTGSSANQKSFLTNRANEAKNTGCDLYLAIHSNAATGKTRGTRIYYYTKSAESLRFAKVLQSTFNYPDKSNIKLAYNDALMVMYLPTMPHALIETAFHDNPQDVAWIKSNINTMAKSLADAVNEFAKGSTGTAVASGLSMDRIFANLSTGTAIILNVSSTTGQTVPSLVWSSSNPAVASVDQGGFVLGMSAGETVISATTPTGTSVRCTVTVTGPTMQIGGGPVASAEGEYVANPTEETGAITPTA